MSRDRFRDPVTQWDLFLLQNGKAPQGSTLYRALRSAERLFERSCRGKGSVRDARALVVLATSAASLVEQLFDEAPSTLSEAVAGFPCFPLAYTDVPREERMRSNMVKALEIGRNDPFKRRGVAEDNLYELIMQGYVLIEALRLRSRIDLPPISKCSRNEWAAALTEFWDPLKSKFRVNDLGIYNASNPKRAIQRRKQRALKRLKKSPSRFISEIEATRLAARKQKIDRMKVSDAELRNGFKEAIAVRLKSILKK